MIVLLALIPATMLSAAGYAVMFLAHRSEGGFRALGRYLGFWAFTLAALILLGALVAGAHAGRWHGMMMRGAWGEGPAGQCPYMAPWRAPPPGFGPPGAPPLPPAPAAAPGK
jgi:hypothetical protein